MADGAAQASGCFRRWLAVARAGLRLSGGLLILVMSLRRKTMVRSTSFSNRSSSRRRRDFLTTFLTFPIKPFFLLSARSLSFDFGKLIPPNLGAAKQQRFP